MISRAPFDTLIFMPSSSCWEPESSHSVTLSHSSEMASGEMCLSVHVSMADDVWRPADSIHHDLTKAGRCFRAR